MEWMDAEEENGHDYFYLLEVNGADFGRNFDSEVC
jgi:hypothetical protein